MLNELSGDELRNRTGPVPFCRRLRSPEPLVVSCAHPGTIRAFRLGGAACCLNILGASCACSVTIRVPSVWKTDVQPVTPHARGAPGENRTRAGPIPTGCSAFELREHGWRCRVTLPVDLLARQVSVLTRPSPWHDRKESNLPPRFWRPRCALRSVVFAPRTGVEPVSTWLDKPASAPADLQGVAHFLGIEPSSPRLQRGAFTSPA